MARDGKGLARRRGISDGTEKDQTDLKYLTRTSVATGVRSVFKKGQLTNGLNGRLGYIHVRTVRWI